MASYPYEPKKLRITHEALVDAILAHPAARVEQLAQMFDYSPTYINILMRTDAFREKLAERRAELMDPILTATIQNRLDALADRSVEVMLEKLAKPNVSDRLAADALDISLKAKGFGARTAPTVNMQFVAVLPTPVANAADWEASFKPAHASPVFEEIQQIAAAPDGSTGQ